MSLATQVCNAVQNTRDCIFFKSGLVRVAVLSVLATGNADAKCEPLDHNRADVAALTARALACLSTGDLKSAVAMQNRAVSILKRTRPTAELELALAWTLLGVIQRQAGQLPTAEFSLTQALRLYDRREDASGSDIANAALNLATVSYLQDKYDKAERLFERAQETWEQCCTYDTVQRAHLLNNTAAMNSRRGRVAHATALYRQAIELYRTTLGENDTMVAIALNNLARVETEQRNYAEAEDLHLRAAAIWQRLELLAHPAYAALLGNYGALLTVLQRYDESERMHRRALDVLRLCCGEEHPEYAARLADYAYVLRKLNRKKEAADLSARAAALAEKRAPTGTAFTVDLQDLSQ